MPAVPLGASVADGVIAMATSDLGIVAVTEDGTSESRVHAIVTPRDLACVFGEDPVQLLQELHHSTTIREVGELNRRVRELALRYLTSPGAVDWVARFTQLTDAKILKHILSTAEPLPKGCWCFCGSSGRGESLTMSAPHVVVILEHDRDRARAISHYETVLETFAACGYLPRVELSLDRAFCVASMDEWKVRYTNWIRDPIRQEMYRARSLFDLRPIYGSTSLWQGVQATVDSSIDRDFVHVLANDCLTSLPPLTFFQDVVIDTSGEQTEVFHLEDSALRPLVDVGRVFGMAARRTLGRSTRDRLLAARSLLPAYESIFREASDAFSIVLWQQGRIGIAQRTSGAELAPSQLSRNDRHILKSGFRSILGLLEFTADPAWLDLL